MSVEQFARGIEMPSVAGRLDDHCEDGPAQVPHRQVGEDLARPPRWQCLQIRPCDHRVGSADLLEVSLDHRLGRRAGVDPPRLVVCTEIHCIAGHHSSEPEPLQIETEVLDQPEAAPTRWQDSPTQRLVRQA